MIKPVIGIVDYGAGNCASVRSTLTSIGYRTRLVNHIDDFADIDLIVLPGVGAFSKAMNSLHKLGLVSVIKRWAIEGRPIIGICLGMQLLSEASYEHQYTRGLELIPGEVVQLSEPGWHIGWNYLEEKNGSNFISDSIGSSFYFNHSFEFKSPQEYVVSIARLSREITAIVKRDNIIGIQFHPEKSQLAGRRILKKSLEALLNA